MKRYLIKDTISHIGSSITLVGWLKNKREHGKVNFFELFDHTGVLQMISSTQYNCSLASVIQVKGKIIARADEHKNPKLLTGNIEMLIEDFTVLSTSEPLPFSEEQDISEELKLKYRYLYLRTKKMQKTLRLRAKLLKFFRDYLTQAEFLEVQTPIITCSSPEGARDFLIPSRLHHGLFYALPQAPQIFKQLLMVSCVDKYFQIAPCFRDEDLRLDRCFEFYQVDLEMSFVTQEQVLEFGTKLISACLKSFQPEKELIISRYTYDEVLETWGSDKPDLRIPLRAEDWTDFFKKSSFELFKREIINGKIVKGIKLNKILQRKQIDWLNEQIEANGFKIAYVYKKDNEIFGPLKQFITIINENESIFFICDMPKTNKVSIIIKLLDQLLNLKNTNVNHLIQVVDFPMFEYENGQCSFAHNPFSDNDGDKAAQYDFVLNGFELASGAIRNTNIEKLIANFAKCGYSREIVMDKFRCMLNAFRYGVPPHGGFAIGFERLLMILTNEYNQNIREVIAFPLNTSGNCPLTGAPTEVTVQQLKDLGILVK